MAYDFKYISELTQSNLHTGARIELAKLFKMERAAKIFTGIQLIIDGTGEMPQELLQLRSDWTDKMLIAVARTCGTDLADKARRAL